MCPTTSKVSPLERLSRTDRLLFLMVPLVVFGLGVDCARKAVYPLDLYPVPVDRASVEGEPDSRWITTHGNVDLESIASLQSERPPSAISLRTRELPGLLVIASAQLRPELLRLAEAPLGQTSPSDHTFAGVLVHLKGPRVEYQGRTFTFEPEDCDRPNCLGSLVLLDGEGPPGILFRAAQGLIALALGVIAILLVRHTLRQGAASSGPAEPGASASG